MFPPLMIFTGNHRRASPGLCRARFVGKGNRSDFVGMHKLDDAARPDNERMAWGSLRMAAA